MSTATIKPQPGWSRGTRSLPRLGLPRLAAQGSRSTRPPHPLLSGWARPGRSPPTPTNSLPADSSSGAATSLPRRHGPHRGARAAAAATTTLRACQQRSTLELRPVFHRVEPRIRAHVLLCCLALLLIPSPKAPQGRPGDASPSSSAASTPSPSPGRAAASSTSPRSTRHSRRLWGPRTGHHHRATPRLTSTNADHQVSWGVNARPLPLPTRVPAGQGPSVVRVQPHVSPPTADPGERTSTATPEDPGVFQANPTRRLELSLAHTGGGWARPGLRDLSQHRRPARLAQASQGDQGPPPVDPICSAPVAAAPGGCGRLHFDGEPVVTTPR